jgi:DNA-3-methyladenine glycosylase
MDALLKPFNRSFFAPSARIVARDLLGHMLVRNTEQGQVAAIIVETEAYLTGDPACHGAPGLTPRNQVMFGPGGYAYVYFIYGCHFCVNAVCQPSGTAEAVLIRAAHPFSGEAIMQAARPVTHGSSLTNGPGKLCQALKIDRSLNGADLCDAGSAVFIAENKQANVFRNDFGPMLTGPRIGITQAVELPLRFWLSKNPFVSKNISTRKRQRRNGSASTTRSPV